MAWLLLFTFGLSGALPFLSRPYTFGTGESELIGYTLLGLVALAGSVVCLKYVPFWATFDAAIENLVTKTPYRRFPADVASFVVLIVALRCVSDLTGMWSSFFHNDYLYVRQLVICTVLVALIMTQVGYIARVVKSDVHRQDVWAHTAFYKVRTLFRESFLMSSAGIQMTLILGIVFASGFGFMVLFVAPHAVVLYVPLFLIVTIPALVILYRRIGDLNRIVQRTDELLEGRLDRDLLLRGHSVLAHLAGNVNRLRLGVARSQSVQAKSERLKTELITNVSHDLRTPLTSLITYTQLLRDEALSSEQRKSYIDILDRKSRRLKVLIDDLFEASKVASGSVDLEEERVDVNQLLQQALAENDELMSESTLQFRVTTPDKPIYCIGDGQKLWRVFDNLMGNILKYSLDGTRVYIALQVVGSDAVVTFKNVSKYELGENVDELFERFKRGDTSRHTDGSGLGLAIAKSIVDLHGGRLDIEVDGDLFKVTVVLHTTT